MAKTKVFWIVTACRVVNNSRRFEISYCLHLQGQAVQEEEEEEEEEEEC